MTFSSINTSAYFYLIYDFWVFGFFQPACAKFPDFPPQGCFLNSCRCFGIAKHAQIRGSEVLFLLSAKFLVEHLYLGKLHESEFGQQTEQSHQQCPSPWFNLGWNSVRRLEARTLLSSFASSHNVPLGPLN